MKSLPQAPTNVGAVLSELKRLCSELKGVPKRLLSVNEAAINLGISPKTIRNGLGPRAQRAFPVQPVRVAGRVLFPIERLDQFVDDLKGMMEPS